MTNRLTDAEASILAELASATGASFDAVRSTTIRRRLARYARSTGGRSLDALLAAIAAHSAEAEALAREILVGPSSFFEEPEAVEQLTDVVLPQLLDDAAAGERPLSAWVAGCGTGEEAYSLAIAVLEAQDRHRSDVGVRLFATDVHDGALATARRARYSESDLANVDPERRGRYFVAEGDGWRVRPEVRDTIAFAHHDLLVDAPFTQIDVLICRNSIKNFTDRAQREALWALGLALRPQGVLMLGENESPGPAADLFTEVGGCATAYRMTGDPTSSGVLLRSGWATSRTRASYPRLRDQEAGPGLAPVVDGGARLMAQAHEAVYRAEGIGALVLTDDRRLVQVAGRAVDWLEFPPGAPPTDATWLIASAVLRTAVVAVIEQLEDGVDDPVEVVTADLGSGPEAIEIRGAWIEDGRQRRILVHARSGSRGRADGQGVSNGGGPSPAVRGDEATIDELDRRVRAANSHLEAVERQHATALEQLALANEDLEVSNERFEASLDQLAAVNEELRTMAAENELRLQEVLELGADLDHVLDATDIGILLLDADRAIRRFNPGCGQFFALLDTDIGRPLDHFRAAFDVGELNAAIGRALDGEAIDPFEVETTLPTRRTLLVNVTSYELGQGGQGASVVFIDSTAAKDRERDRERILDRLTETLRDTGVVLWERTPDMRTQWVSDNFEEVVGFSVEDWEDRFPDLDVLHPDDVEALRDYMSRQREMIAGEIPTESTEIDFRTRTAAGSYRTINARVSVVCRNGDTVIRGMNVDVTAERRRESEQSLVNQHLVRLNEDLSEFTHILSHDLRAPLRTIRLLTEVLRDEADLLSPRSAEHLAMIESKTEVMRGLIEDLLDYARSGDLPSPTLRTNLQSLVEDAIDLATDREGIDVIASCDIGAIATQTVPLSTCIRNLVDNAIKYHPGPTGRVTVRGWRDGDVLTITVADDGAGIDPDLQDRIFLPFESLTGGSGLGLATIKKIVTDRGGSITLDSALGRGSAFTITWPLSDPGEQTAPIPPATTSSVADGQTL